ncbi:2-hydroxymuconate tautomerase family protein [Pseudodesulfovibrio sp. JC047]|uniref:tautomerase family protein n=1 Tax=Pseudodesulfovibrio sp. JC047 TaxID=2683199 RepID=UPI0013D7F304|nr:2-hydroxymuconate tautomerase family protein [Pseudodesulfovibrio sp. JC047]NDV19633.1 2-hydroxymuconate tautomerase family protein [Pseudodesulfovibrio sp. JC047]
MPILTLQTWAGTPLEKKRELVDTLTREIVRMLECPKEAVTVLIEEVPKENWGAAGELCSERFPDK